jgi:putative ABC transport system ATP-binding protein
MKDYNKDAIRNILNYLIFCDKRFFGLIAVYGVIVALLNLALPLSIQVLITSVIYTALIQPVVVLSAVLLFLISFATVLSILQKFLIEIYKRNSFFATVKKF